MASRGKLLDEPLERYGGQGFVAARGATVGRVTARHPTPEERDERVVLPLDPEAALRALLRVDPDSQPVEDSPETDETPTK